MAKNRKKNSKGFYSYIKKKTKNKVTVGPLKDKDVTVSDDEAMANLALIQIEDLVLGANWTMSKVGRFFNTTFIITSSNI